MTLKTLLFTVLFIGSASVAAQQTFAGRVVAKNTGKGIPYATVIALPERKGVYTDSAGYFTVVVKRTPDSIRAEAIGYATATVVASAASSIILSPLSYTTEAVTVKAKQRKGKMVKYGNTKFSIVTNGYGSVKGHKIVRYLGGDWKSDGTLESAIFRLDIEKTKGCRVFARALVYSATQMGVSGGPDEQLLQRDVTFELKSLKSLYEIDLRADNINYPPEGLCVGIEFLGGEPGCETEKVFKNQVFVLTSSNEPEQVTYQSRYVETGKWRYFSTTFSTNSGKNVNAKFAAKVRY